MKKVVSWSISTNIILTTNEKKNKFPNANKVGSC